jgi:hypothetical protein
MAFVERANFSEEGAFYCKTISGYGGAVAVPFGIPEG